MILDEMADTFRQRNAVYGDNYRMVGKMMAVLFPRACRQRCCTAINFTCSS